MLSYLILALTVVLALPGILVLPTMGATANPLAQPSDYFAPDLQHLAELAEAGRDDDLFDQAEILLPKVQEKFKSSSWDEAKTLDFLVQASYGNDRAKERQAMVRGEKAIRIKEVLLGPHDPELAHSLTILGKLHMARQENEQALSLFDRALIILKANGTEYDLGRASILGRQGQVYEKLGELEAAAEAYGQALAIQVRILGPDHPDIAETMGRQAGVLSKSSKGGG